MKIGLRGITLTGRGNTMQITQKGQITIPVEIRERYGFLPNTSIEFEEENNKVYIVKSQISLAKENPFDYVRGKASSGLSTDEIMKLTRSDDSSDD